MVFLKHQILFRIIGEQTTWNRQRSVGNRSTEKKIKKLVRVQKFCFGHLYIYSACRITTKSDKTVCLLTDHEIWHFPHCSFIWNSAKRNRLVGRLLNKKNSIKSKIKFFLPNVLKNTFFFRVFEFFWNHQIYLIFRTFIFGHE